MTTSEWNSTPGMCARPGGSGHSFPHFARPIRPRLRQRRARAGRSRSWQARSAEAVATVEVPDAPGRLLVVAPDAQYPGNDEAAHLYRRVRDVIVAARSLASPEYDDPREG